jgi:hypothetical protein
LKKRRLLSDHDAIKGRSALHSVSVSFHFFEDATTARWKNLHLSQNFLTLKEPKNRFQGTNSARLCSLAGRYDNPIPTRFLAPIDCLKIPALNASHNNPLRIDLTTFNTLRSICPASSGKEKTKCDRIAPSHPLSWPCVSDLITPTSKARADYAP